MKNKISHLSVALLIILVLVGGYWLNKAKEQTVKIEVKAEPKKQLKTKNSFFVDEATIKNNKATDYQIYPTRSFDPRLAPQALKKQYHKLDLNGSIRGAIVPHHLLASSLIAEVFSQLESENINKVIVIGPNHFEKGEARVILSDWGWRLQGGSLVKPAVFETRAIAQRCSFCSIEPLVVENEHAIADLTIFINHFLPKAKLMPIIVKQGSSLDQARELGRLLGKIADQNTVIIASVDFSHYLDKQQTKGKDKQSWKAIRNGDLVKIKTFNNDNLDSPGSIIALLEAMNYLNANQVEKIRNTCSQEIMHDAMAENTSYITAVFVD
ncbi:MAG: AmmeMemoRadiSam system protein B [Candidatus Moranbacteria bacterium]|nr:AmmeMemoRadiSam system protein B [Candidatus Moranbacteria bacterium]